MKHLLPFVLFVLSVLSSSAQYRYNLYTAHSGGTNSYVPAFSNSTSIDLSMDVGQGNYAQILVYYSLISTNTNAVPASCTNLVTTLWDASMDGSHFTNEWLFSVRSTTNGNWGMTNIAVTYPYLRYRRMTNDNAAHLTNFMVRVGQKIGL